LIQALVAVLALLGGMALMAGDVAHPEATLYDPARNASVDVDAALARANATNKRVIVALGANWCHDSRTLAGWFATPRFRQMLTPRYEIVFVDIGSPQTGKGRNMDVATRFGIRKIKGTPIVVIVSPEGGVLNRKDAPKWRNAASRTEEDIFKYFFSFGG
jgi:hypothetical protein